MPTLLFNSNYLSILVPTASEAAGPFREGDPFFVRCMGNFWAVSDLDQQWGIDDFPLPTAKWIFEFLGAPAQTTPGADEAESKAEGEYYPILLHSATHTDGPMLVLCLADADRALWGVATNDQASSLVAHLSSEDAHVWLPVSMRGMERSDDMRDIGTLFASLHVRGGKVADWTSATFDLAADPPFEQTRRSEDSGMIQGKLGL